MKGPVVNGDQICPLWRQRENTKDKRVDKKSKLVLAHNLDWRVNLNTTLG